MERCRVWGLLWAFWALAIFSPVSSANANEPIALGQRDWDGSRAITYVLKDIIETRLGYPTRIVESNDAEIFAEMHRGNGRIDVLTDLWMPNQADQWAKYIDEHQSVAVNEQPYSGHQGLFIPGYIQDKYQIRSVHDLANPDIAKLFDSDGDGKGEYWPGALGWSSTHIEQVKAKSYGYAPYFTPYIAPDRMFKAKLKADYASEQGILFYYWTPEWIHAAYDLRRLEEPSFDGFAMASKKGAPRYKADGCWNMILPRESTDWLNQSRVTCAWPDAKVYVAFSVSLIKRAPKVARFLKQVAFDADTVNEWIWQIGKQGREPAVVASEWVKAHPDIVKIWLADIQP
ncbi:ABC transporter substrate-binding protein [Candidatus Entotheonella palauensis]|uniref:ABC-type glycine betaine transport system substrate-binding domain-containing protein n=1 Tax=Candidatus Entotheonella gemina TaxID=1429439 RepID=W4LQZ7_9BACT|nr:glycine betaine ABC transporter substrate-binding protein [Candidatus Entotheonella palauensis]ETX00398.1 MAG: hypothetical protein ETSY2_39160 [Candidatus Entotheonella gemina]